MFLARVSGFNRELKLKAIRCAWSGKLGSNVTVIYMGMPIPKTVTWASPVTLDFLKVLWIFFSGWFFSRLPRSLGRRATSLKLAFSRSLRSLKTYERPTCSKSTVTQSQVAKVIWKWDAYMNRVLGMGMSISLYQRREKDKKSLSSTPARLPNLTTVLEPGAGQGIPYPDRGA